MLHLAEIWSIIKKYMPRDRWVSVEEIRDLVESNATLDTEDFEPEAPGSNIPKWRRNVRNVLVQRKRKGDIRWNKQMGNDSKYFIT